MRKEISEELNIGLNTIEPNLSAVRSMQARIGKIGDSLYSDGVRFSEPEYKYPSEFLANPLSVEQRKIVDSAIAIDYARDTVRLQDLIATVPIEESGEPFVFLPELFSKERVIVDFSDIPFHVACGEWAGKPKDFWIRSGVGEKLLKLGRAFNNEGLKIKFEDGFRPVGVQEGLFKRRVEWTRAENPDWSWEQILVEARSKTAVTPRLASHKAGAAVDMTLSTLDGSSLDLGNKYPEGGALVVLDCPYITQEQWETRQIFAQSARMAGFTVYPGEDWHISSGDNLASLSVPEQARQLYVAKYGPVKTFDRITGEVNNIYSDDELNVVFQS